MVTRENNGKHWTYRNTGADSQTLRPISSSDTCRDMGQGSVIIIDLEVVIQKCTLQNRSCLDTEELYMKTVLASFMVTEHKLKSFGKKEPQVRKCSDQTGL